jgi:hypothetical protein
MFFIADGYPKIVSIGKIDINAYVLVLLVLKSDIKICKYIKRIF